jgi:cytosine/adenosine deaminase-related metal-dependent hydrolase
MVFPGLAWTRNAAVEELRAARDFRHARSEITGGACVIRGNVIEQVGPTGALPQSARSRRRSLAATCSPGFVNTHQHMFQSLDARNHARRSGFADCLFDWLRRRIIRSGAGSTRRT